ncbi:MAG: hypothetical protein H7X93_00865 [Sphingomonadaceae bacterium]|nr:hypothetical protein [Sphingomonadaceae bacterium]
MSNQRVKTAIAKIDSSLTIIEGYASGGRRLEGRLRRDQSLEQRLEREAERYAVLRKRFEDAMAKRTGAMDRLRANTRAQLDAKDKVIAELRQSLAERGADSDDALRREHESLKHRYAALRERATGAVVQLDGLIGAARGEAL